VTPTRVTNDVSCNWVDSLQVSSVQFSLRAVNKPAACMDRQNCEQFSIQALATTDIVCQTFRRLRVYLSAGTPVSCETAEPIETPSDGQTQVGQGTMYKTWVHVGGT